MIDCRFHPDNFPDVEVVSEALTRARKAAERRRAAEGLPMLDWDEEEGEIVETWPELPGWKRVKVTSPDDSTTRPTLPRPLPGGGE